VLLDSKLVISEMFFVANALASIEVRIDVVWSRGFD